MEKIPLIIAEDCEITRIGLRQLVESSGKFEIIAETTAKQETVQQALSTRPAAVLVGTKLGDESGIEVCREIKEKTNRVKVLLLADSSEAQLALAALLAGADGYITKQMPAETLVQGLFAVLCGNSVLLPSSVTEILRKLAEVEDDDPALLELLSVQEKKILTLIADGKTNKEIAAILSLSEKTVKNYVSNILGKLRLSNRAEAAALMARHKLWFNPSNWSD